MGVTQDLSNSHISTAEMAAIARLSLVPCNRLALVQRPVVRQWTQTGARALATTPASRDIDSAAKFIGAGAATVGYARNPSLKQQLFSYAILGFALSEAMGLFCLMM